jgi:hypothetical protein
LISNVLKDPSNEKFRKVNLDNENIQKRVTKINGGLQILKGAGFKQSDEGNFLVITDIDEALIKQVVQLLQDKITN